MKLFKAAKDLVAKQLDNSAPGPPGGAGGHHAAHWPRQSDPVLEHLLRDFRSSHLRKLFFAHDPAEYTDLLDVRLLAGTYNVAGKKPPPGQKLHEWVDQWKHCWPREAAAAAGGGSAPGAGAAEAAAAAADGPDIVAVGFQEVVPLSAGNVIAGPSSDGADAWDYALAATLNGDAWASKNAGRAFGSGVTSQAAYLNLGAQAAYAAYSMVASQAATVVGAMDKVWSGAEGGSNGSNSEAGAPDSAQQQQARLAYVLSCAEDGEDVYVQIASKQLVGLYLSVWARKRLARSVRGVQAASTATGWGGYLGNKGAVAVRLRVHDAPLLLVCSHLASGDADGDEARRNADVRDIMRRCTFADGPDAAGGAQQGEGRQQAGGQWGALGSILDHDNVVWLGDLNYRLACSDEEARRCLRAGRLEALLQYDELSREMAAGRVFQGWCEGAITFPPTYKYHLGCNVYSGDPLPPGLLGAVKAVDSYASLTDSEATTEGGDSSAASAAGRDSPSVEKQKKRTPAWCDRVLWRPDRQLYQLAYGRGELAVSDHRPVAAAFLLQAHRYRRDRVQQLAEDMRRAVDMSSNAARPRCSLEPRFIELGLLPFGAHKAFTLQLTNTGPVAARFYFVAPPKPRQSADGAMLWDDNQPLCPPWLTISHVEGEVAQGESACITLTAAVTGGGPGSAAAFLESAAPPPPPRGQQPAQHPAPPGAGAAAAAAATSTLLDAILILRLEDGADAFVSLRGTALPSCYGMDLDRLLTLGDSPVLPVEQLGPEGQDLLQQGLQQQQEQQEQDGASLAARVGDLGLGDLGGDLGPSSSGGAGAGGAPPHAAAPAVAPRGSSGLEARVPKEVLRLVHFLEAPHRLATPGLFVDSCQACLTASAGGAGSSSSSSAAATHGAPGTQQLQQQQLQQLLAATAPVRWALDTGLDLPAHVTPHQAAAALLLLLQQLPDSLMPPDVSAILMHCVPPGPACSSLLSDTMSVAEWATLRMVLGLCKAALAPPAAIGNRLTVVALAGTLAEALFGGPSQASQGVHPGLVANRIAFVMTLLDPDAAAQQQQQQQQQHGGAPGSLGPAGGAGATAGGGGGGGAVQRRVQPPAESLI